MINHLSIFATTRCNLKCLHCMVDFPKKPIDFPLDLLDKLLGEARVYGVQHVGMSGGESCLHPEFGRMVSMIAGKGYTWNAVTNGLDAKAYLKTARKFPGTLNYLGVSIDGADEETHDYIRARRGAFKITTSAVKEFVAEKIPVLILVTMNNRNKNQVEGFLKLAEEIGAEGISFGGIIPTAWNQQLLLSDEEFSMIYQQIQDLKPNIGVRVRIASSLHTRGGVDFCNALHLHQMMFNAKGELIFCCDCQKDEAVIGSFKTESLPSLIDRWLKISYELQSRRAQMISQGQMANGFDTCTFCNQHFTKTRNNNLLIPLSARV